MLDPHLEERHHELQGRVRELGERHLRGAAGDEEDPSAARRKSPDSWGRRAS